jgi:hypothetical protein
MGTKIVVIGSLLICKLQKRKKKKQIAIGQDMIGSSVRTRI